MNYLRELLAFHATCIISPVSARAMAMWYTLMYFSNMARWHFPITIREMQLRGQIGLNHEQFINARKELVEGGYVIHHRQLGNKAAKYTMVQLSKGD